jgi:hypothetical protein
MTTYPKVRRTVRIGLRSVQEEIAPSLRVPAQKMKERVEILLANNCSMNEEDSYLLSRAKIAAKRLLTQNDSEKQELLLQLDRLEEKGHKLGFSQEDIGGMNALSFLIKKEGKLKEFIQQAETRLKGSQIN